MNQEDGMRVSASRFAGTGRESFSAKPSAMWLRTAKEITVGFGM